MPLLRPRFSLLTILLMMALVACGITIWQLWREVGPLRAEVRQLRDETGRLFIDDSTKLHAIQTRQPDELTWRWRIWIPPGRSYIIHTCGGRIPKLGFPAHNGSMTISEPGETWIEYRITKDPRSGGWQGKTSTKSGSIGNNEPEWVDWQNRVGESDGVGTSNIAAAPDKPLILTRQRFGQVSDARDIPDPAAGFMLWLEPW